MLQFSLISSGNSPSLLAWALVSDSRNRSFLKLMNKWWFQFRLCKSRKLWKTATESWEIGTPSRGKINETVLNCSQPWLAFAWCVLRDPQSHRFYTFPCVKYSSFYAGGSICIPPIYFHFLPPTDKGAHTSLPFFFITIFYGFWTRSFMVPSLQATLFLQSFLALILELWALFHL